MFYEINNIYQYIFGDYARIDVANVPQELKAKKIEQIQTKIKEEFSLVLAENRTLFFRQMLGDIKSEDLENVLFGKHIEPIIPIDVKKYNEYYKFPSEKTIKEHFQNLNNDYLYFKDNDFELFLKFFKVSKVIADYIECNNTSNNEVAFQHAYKMMVLFGPASGCNFFARVNSFLKNHNYFQLNSPLHDALVRSIPKNDPPIDIENWRQFILKGGPQSLKCFQTAPQIQRELNKVPSTVEEALLVITKLIYSRSHEHLELAKLCQQYNLSEEVFNKSLEVEKNRKQKDNLPNVVIDGETVNHPGFYLVKLPIDDPRAYLLGHITNCCQSIGGHGEKCVIDGITRENNGFYVLLKRLKNTSSTKPFITETKIDYDNFQIIGQGYAWIGKEGNLTFDSWENLREEDDAVIVPVLECFSREMTQDPYPFLRVTIGQGGRTPQVWKKCNSVHPAEVILEGAQYGDSSHQSIIYCNEERRDRLINDEIKSEETNINEKFPGLFKILSQECNYSINKINESALLLRSKFIRSILVDEKDTVSTQILKDIIEFVPWNKTLKLFNHGILAELISSLKVIYPNLGKRCENISEIFSACLDLKIAGIYEIKNRDFILANAEYSYDISDKLIKLKNEDVYDVTLRDWILAKVKELKSIYSDLDKKPLLPLSTVFSLCSDLKIADIYDDKLRDWILTSKNSYKTKSTCKTLIELKHENIYDEKLRDWLLSPDCRYDVIEVLIMLKHENIYDEKLRDWILAMLENTSGDFVKSKYTSITDYLADLKKKNIYNSKIRDCILAYPKYAFDIANCLKKSKDVGLYEDIQDSILENPAEANKIYALARLNKANIYDSKLIDFLATNPSDCHYFADYIVSMKENYFLDDANLDFMLKNYKTVSHAFVFYLLELKAENLYNIKTRDCLFKNMELARYIKDALLIAKNSGIDEDQIINWILEHPKSTFYISDSKESDFARTINKLLELKKQKLYDKYCKHILSHLEFVHDIYYSHERLKKYEIDDDITCDWIFLNPKYANKVTITLRDLNERKLYDSKVRDRVLSNPEICGLLENLLQELSKKSLLLSIKQLRKILSNTQFLANLHQVVKGETVFDQKLLANTINSLHTPQRFFSLQPTEHTQIKIDANNDCTKHVKNLST